MLIGLIGRKLGMSRVFAKDGTSIPVTLIRVESNSITQIKTVAKDGYNSIQVTTGFRRKSKINKPLAGLFLKACVTPGYGLWELYFDNDHNYKVGEELKASILKKGQVVDVSGVSKGKGFAGVIKRHHFSAQRATHGNSLSHRVPGSIGQCQTPGKVFKGKKMPGHMGNVNVTVQNLKVIDVDNERNIVFIKGAIPGSLGGVVKIKSSIKSNE